MELLGEKIERHKKFLNMQEVERPLCGCCIGGWENLSRYVNGTDELFSQGMVNVKKIDVSKFSDIYRKYTEGLTYNDDLIRSVEPFQSLPWTEAAIGCPVNFTGKNLWAGILDESIEDAYLEKVIKDENPVIEKYAEFIELLKSSFGSSHPIGQAILRGPLDMVSAAVGEENMIYSLVDRPEEMKKLISMCTEIFMRFLKIQTEKAPKFMGGSVIGQYYIWTPGTCSRLQEDSMSLLSPDLYEEFAQEPLDRISKVVQYNLFHIHASALFLIDHILKNNSIRIVQVSKDEGVRNLEPVIEKLRKIQEAGKCLLLKGRFDSADIDLIHRKLDTQGLCVQAVVDTADDAYEVMKVLKTFHR